MQNIHTDFSQSFYEKLFILNNLSLPKDIIETEIKTFCFHEKIVGLSKKIKNQTNEIVKRAFSTYGQEEHWAFGYSDINDNNNNNETLQLQGINCSICGNYRYFNSINTYDARQFRYILCMCAVHGW
jgi:hypothetical protein